MRPEKKLKDESNFKLIAIGVSAGAMEALSIVIPKLPATFSIPIVIIQHISPHSDNYMTRYLDTISAVHVKEVDEKERVRPGVVYTAPPNYHVLLEEDETFSLSVEERINFARPSIDVFFESAADVYRSHMVGIILTGANNDGSKGLNLIKKVGGLTIVQDPKTADVDGMPKAALQATKVDHVLPLEEIGPFLVKLGTRKIRETRLPVNQMYI